MRYLFLVFAFFSVHAFAAVKPLPIPAGLRQIVLQQSEETQVPAPVLYGVMFAESTFRQYVVNTGSYGYMQINAKMHPHLRYLAWQRYKTWNLFDPRVNVFVSAHLLQRLYQKFGSWESALHHYSDTRNSGYATKVLVFAYYLPVYQPQLL